MTFVSIPNGVRIVHLGHVGSVQIVNTVGCENGGGSEIGSSLSDLAKSHGDAWRAHVVPTLSAAYSHDATLAYSLEDQSLAAGDAGYSTSAAGGDGSQVTTLSNCLVVSLKTAKRGRTYQGRMFISALNPTRYAGDGRQWGVATVNGFGTLLSAYKDAVDPAIGSNGRMAICSKGSPSHNIPPHVEPVTAVLVRPYIGTQRGRLN